VSDEEGEDGDGASGVSLGDDSQAEAPPASR
jgi:hypothetical protein